MGYFDDEAEHEAGEWLRQRIEAKGKLLVDFLNVPQVEANLIASETVSKQGTMFHIHRRIHEGWIEKSIQEWEEASAPRRTCEGADRSHLTAFDEAWA